MEGKPKALLSSWLSLGFQTNISNLISLVRDKFRVVQLQGQNHTTQSNKIFFFFFKQDGCRGWRVISHLRFLFYRKLLAECAHTHTFPPSEAPAPRCSSDGHHRPKRRTTFDHLSCQVPDDAQSCRRSSSTCSTATVLSERMLLMRGCFIHYCLLRR